MEKIVFIYNKILHMNKQLFKKRLSKINNFNKFNSLYKSNKLNNNNKCRSVTHTLIQKFQIVLVEFLCQSKEYLHQLLFKCKNKLLLNKVLAHKIIYHLIIHLNHNHTLINLNNLNNNKYFKKKIQKKILK